MVRRNFKIGTLDAANVNISANGFLATLTANSDLASNVSFSLPGAIGTTGQVLTTDGSGNLYFSDSSANTQAYVGDTLVSNTALILEAGDGVSLLANADSGVISFSTSMSNVTSQTIAVDGSANSFTLAKSVSNSHMVLVSYNGLLQGPEEYSVDGTTLTISNSKPLIADSKIEVRYFDFFSLPGTSEGGGGGASFQGSVSGYTSGGYTPSFSNYNNIDKFSFSSDGNATDVGDLTQARTSSAGQSSTESGYTSGQGTTIDKFPFATDGNASDVGDLTRSGAGAGQSSSTNGYSSGGGPAIIDNIDKFSFSADGNATDVGDLTIGRRFGMGGQSSTTSGYTSGGTPLQNTIDKFPFSTDSNATDVGDLTDARYVSTGQSSTESGYTSGGAGFTTRNTIDKFPFASDSNAADVGDLTQPRYAVAGQSSTVSGYTSAGDYPSTRDIIDKFPFSSDGNATDVGDLSSARSTPAGQQV